MKKVFQNHKTTRCHNPDNLSVKFYDSSITKCCFVPLINFRNIKRLVSHVFKFKMRKFDTSSFPFKQNTNNFKQTKRSVNNELHSIINYSDMQQLYCTD